MTWGGEREESWETYELARRAVLKATGGAAALSLGAGMASAATSDSTVRSTSSPAIDPVFGEPSLASAAGDVELHIGIPGLLLGLGASGVLNDGMVTAINNAVEDGSVDENKVPNRSVKFGGESVPLSAVAHALAGTTGFHYDPAGLHVKPETKVVFSAETPDHGITAYHDGHGRQNRVPSGVGPISSPLVPHKGHWKFEFTTEGVYDLYCPPHEPFGMVMRVVVWDESGDVPELNAGSTGPMERPPESENLLSFVLGGLDPEVPSAAEALISDALSPQNIVQNSPVDWHDVVDEYRKKS